MIPLWLHMDMTYNGTVSCNADYSYSSNAHDLSGSYGHNPNRHKYKNQDA